MEDLCGKLRESCVNDQLVPLSVTCKWFDREDLHGNLREVFVCASGQFTPLSVTLAWKCNMTNRGNVICVNS